MSQKYKRAWYQKNRKRLIKKYLKAYDKVGRWKLILKKYGLTKDQWMKIYNDQEGRCYLCQRTDEQIRKGRMKYLCVDHDHATGRNRGLICGFCNRNILPWMERFPGYAQRVQEYLTRETDYGFALKEETDE